jgi:hypothetical protein
VYDNILPVGLPAIVPFDKKLIPGGIVVGVMLHELANPPVFVAKIGVKGVYLFKLIGLGM